MRWWFDTVTLALWFALAAVGIALRCRRLYRLYRVILPAPIDPDDVAYLRQVIRSTYLRLVVKATFLVGAVLALTDVPWLWPAWRLLVILALACMLAETAGVDHARARLSRPHPHGGTP